MFKINLLIIATNKYIVYLKGLLDSADEFFLKNHDVIFNIFTDKSEEVVKLLKDTKYNDRIRLFAVEHKPFPYTTLYRYHFFKRYEDNLKDADYNFYIDADTLIKQEIKDDILSERTATQHCGFVNERGSYENRPESTSFVAENEGEIYFGGGFWGFSKEEFWKFINMATETIDIDHKNGIVPVWHDESVLNRYLIDNPPTQILSPSYHFPENNPHIEGKWAKQGVSYDCIILLLDKNHKEIRK